jgi:hypothetical protein
MMMNREQKQDDFIRGLVRQQPQEKAPDGFTGRVMEKVRPAEAISREPFFSPMTWFAIFLGAAALVATVLFLDIPLISDVFSSSGIQKLSFNIFSNSLFESFLSIFKDLKINPTAVIILAAVVSLVVIERVLAAKRSSQEMMVF